ncbi:MAG: ChaN family lipoprotein [Desulfarculaceae bacterium]
MHRAIALSLLTFLSGCAASIPPPRGTVLSFPSGEVLPPPQFQTRLSSSQVILVGETHNHQDHHSLQLEILKQIQAPPGKLVVGIEWLDHTNQPLCDELSQGLLEVNRFAELVNWKQKWGFPLEMYAPIFEEIKNRRLKLVALNAPAAVIRKIARQGIDALTAQERAQLAPAMAVDDPAYQQRLASQYQAHGFKDPSKERSFFLAQVARDETMAYYLAKALSPWPDSGKKAVVFTGSGHLAHGLGLPPRVARRLPGVKMLSIIPVPPQAARLMTEMEPETKPADLVIVSKPAPPRPPRLGVFLKPTPEGLKVLRVMPGTPAAKAGIRPNDFLLRINGKTLKKVKDIHDSINKEPFEPHDYVIKRGEEELRLRIALPRASQ